jgi:hypothetical protein
MSDEAILGLINISDAEKASRAGRLGNGIPPLANWRMTPNVGFRVRENIVSNHFKVDVSSIPQYFHHYDVKIKKCSKDGDILDENVARDGDPATNMIIIKSMYYQHPAWKEQKIGVSYDGRSSLFTTGKLPSVIDISEMMVPDDSDPVPVENDIASSVILAGSKYPYRVELQYTNCVGPMPEVGPDGMLTCGLLAQFPLTIFDVCRFGEQRLEEA